MAAAVGRSFSHALLHNLICVVALVSALLKWQIVPLRDSDKQPGLRDDRLGWGWGSLSIFT